MSLTDFLPALLGGLLIGAASVLLLAGIGRIAGISGITFGLMDRPNWNTANLWRVGFVAGLVAAGAIWTQWTGAPLAPARTANVPLLVISGLLVGWGTSLGSGCTSGHGVCGLGRLSVRSLASVLTFMATGALTVYLARHVFGL
ncbi:MAG: YeeE/YedE family protein [Proteobacteria bacterium]|uniref:YeeE/YedE family protein n=1 Tax=Aquabacterium sp. TaxID=1872578 RepID=UPI0035C6F553|nr:YeeE/YedE family protein [Pseudomonadota bacterium]